jgi:polyisoprenyl-phosphate glycosyltransferase
MTATSDNVAIVVPVYNDWGSFRHLVADVLDTFAQSDIKFEIHAIDDGSTIPFAPTEIHLPPDGSISSIDILGLAVNLGHQRAIATGLCSLADRSDLAGVIVMDGDGEDKPSDIRSLMNESRAHPDSFVVAERIQRSETSGFRIGYFFYRLLFWLLTGRQISFGNFCFIPRAGLRRLAHMPELWNNLPASIMRSRISYRIVPIARGRRYEGRSQMGGVVGLVAHGLTAMSVYTDVIFVRVLLIAAAVGVMSIIGLIVVVMIRLATDLAIPGWATNAAGSLFIVLLLTLVIVIAMGLMMLGNRSLRPIVPIIDAPLFIARRQRQLPES